MRLRNRRISIEITVQRDVLPAGGIRHDVDIVHCTRAAQFGEHFGNQRFDLTVFLIARTRWCGCH